MRIDRNTVGVGLLAVAAGIAVLGVLVYYDFTATYGDITRSGPQEFWRSFSNGIGVLPLVPAGLVALIAALVSPRLRMRLVSASVPVVMLVSMLAVTSPALQKKLESAYDATPQCFTDEEMGAGPGARAARESQQAFESIEHVGHFGGGGGSGVGGCDRPFVLTEDVDVLQHYRTALPDAGWRVIEDGANHLRAERDGMAFELVTCDQGGVVWAGPDDDSGTLRCHHE